MLVIKVYVTKTVEVRADDITETKISSSTILEKIDEIQIKNMGRRDDEMWDYQIVKPEKVGGRIIHTRKDGYMLLLKKALGILIGRKVGI